MNVAIEYVSLLRDITVQDFYGGFPLGRFIRFYDEQPPLNLSRYFWLASGASQRLFEADILAFGKN